jgi:hypothetical protein
MSWGCAEGVVLLAYSTNGVPPLRGWPGDEQRTTNNGQRRANRDQRTAISDQRAYFFSFE